MLAWLVLLDLLVRLGWLAAWAGVAVANALMVRMPAVSVDMTNRFKDEPPVK
jgi:hypothetical protein